MPWYSSGEVTSPRRVRRRGVRAAQASKPRLRGLRERPASEAHLILFFFSSRRRHTRLQGDWSSDVCSSDLRRRCDLEKEKHVDPLEREFWSTVAAYEQLLSEKNGRTTRASRTRNKLKRLGGSKIGRASCRERV